MRRVIKDTPSHRELQVMSVLWECDGATVSAVRDAMNALWEPELAYTTVLTYMRSLVAKGWVKADTSLRAYVYDPVIARHEARGDALMDLIDVLYDGSVDALREDLRTRRFPFGGARS